MWRQVCVSLARPIYRTGANSLLKDAPPSGRQPTIRAEKVAQVIAKTTQSKPATATHWSPSRMTREAGISDSRVDRIWRAHGLKPHRVESFNISRDPDFAKRLDDIVRLRLNPPSMR